MDMDTFDDCSMSQVRKNPDHLNSRDSYEKLSIQMATLPTVVDVKSKVGRESSIIVFYETNILVWLSSAPSCSSQATHVLKNTKGRYVLPPKHINCCIHSLARFSPECMAVIDTPEFQRLRELKQLGLTNYVYPTATHTRL